MEQNIVRDEIIKVRSLKLLVELASAKTLGLLLWVDEDSKDEYPVFKFVGKPNVMEIYNKFIKKYGADDRSMDDEGWKYYNKNIFNDYSREATVITRNKNILQSIIEAGFGANLVEVKKDTLTGKKIYVFLYTPEIYQLKSEGDAVSRSYYLDKQNIDQTKEV